MECGGIWPTPKMPIHAAYRRPDFSQRNERDLRASSQGSMDTNPVADLPVTGKQRGKSVASLVRPIC